MKNVIDLITDSCIESCQFLSNEQALSDQSLIDDPELFNSIKFLFDDHFPVKFLIEAKLRRDNGLIFNTHPLGFIKVAGSFLLDSSFNVILVKSESYNLLLFQHVSSADFVYVVEKNCFVLFCHSNKDIALKSLGRLRVEGLQCSNNAGDCFLTGVIVSHGRPAHFFYDSMVGAHLLHEYGLLKDTAIYQLLSANFYDAGVLYTNKNAIVADFQTLNKKAGLFFKVGCFYASGKTEYKQLLERLDESIVRHISDSAVDSTILRSIEDYKAEGAFVLWFGVTSEKRRWLEQVDAAVIAAHKLALQGVKVILLVDGWTSPMTPSSNDQVQIKNDTVIFDEIVEKMSTDIECLSLIGCTAQEKILLAQHVDFYIANAGTGSIYVSRFAKQNGIVHIANSSRKMITDNYTVHHNVSYIPESWVTDIKNQDFDRMDYTSYSIDPEKVANYLMLNTKKMKQEGSESPFLLVSDSVNCELVSSDDFTDTYVSLNDDPQLIFKFDFKAMDKSLPLKLCFNLTVETVLRDLDIPKFYIDWGRGFNEEDTLIPEKINDNWCVILNDAYNVLAIRLDPMACIGKFKISEIKVSDVSG